MLRRRMQQIADDKHAKRDMKSWSWGGRKGRMVRE
jgi:hypothetical protein